MAKNVKRIILSEKQPNNKHIAWAKPSGDNIDLKIFEDNKWRPIAGGGSSTTVTKYTSDPDAPMLSMDNVNQQLYIIAERLGFTDKPTKEQVEQIHNELKLIKFATFKQGNAVLVDYDLSNSTLTFQCDDGSIITVQNRNIIGLRPDIDGYLIWKTTKNKLPVRESQEETDPEEPNPGGGNTTKSVKPGPSLKIESGGGSEEETPEGTEEVYTVINNNTGEIVDPLELHKLTNVIYIFDQTNCYPCYLIDALYNVENLPPFIQGSAVPISTWKDMTQSPTTQAYYYNYIINYNERETTADSQTY